MINLIVSQDWTGSAPVWAQWHCVDDSHDLGRPVGHGHTANEAVRDYLEQIDNQEADELLWGLTVGMNAEWKRQIEDENAARAALDPYHQLDFYNQEPRS